MHTVFIHVHIDSILIWGLAGTVVLTPIMSLSQRFGYSRMSLPFLLGTLFTSNRNRAQIAGFGCHFLVGWILAFFYALFFETLGLATWWIGLGMGLLHGVFVLATLMPLMPYVHPRMASDYDGPTPTRMLEPAGFMAIHYGRHTPLITLLAHLAYGGILGAFYHVLNT